MLTIEHRIGEGPAAGRAALHRPRHRRSFLGGRAARRAVNSASLCGQLALLLLRQHLLRLRVDTRLQGLGLLRALFLGLLLNPLAALALLVPRAGLALRHHLAGLVLLLFVRLAKAGLVLHRGACVILAVAAGVLLQLLGAQIQGVRGGAGGDLRADAVLLQLLLSVLFLAFLLSKVKCYLMVKQSNRNKKLHLFHFNSDHTML